MTLTDRDRRLLLAIVPIALLVGFWMLLLGPKRDEAERLGSELTEAQSQLDGARQRVQQAEQARTSFAADYETVVRLGKAVPAKVDMPSLLVQLDAAARGTGIEFARVVAGERTTAGQPAAAAPPAAGQPAAGQPAGAPAAGQPAGQAPDPAQSAPGRAAEAAHGAVADANADAAQAGATTEQGQPATPPAGGAPPPAGAAPAPAAPGLEAVPLEFSFSGRFFDLADLLHELKRFVYLGDGGAVVVRGRLMTIDQVSFRSDGGRVLDATIKASVFLAPRAEGVTAGATPAGPAPAPVQPASGGGGVPTPPAAARLP